MMSWTPVIRRMTVRASKKETTLFMERDKEDHRKMVLGAAKSMKELDEGKHPDSYYVDKAVSLAKKGKLLSYLVEEYEKKHKNEFFIDHSSTMH